MGSEALGKGFIKLILVGLLLAGLLSACSDQSAPTATEAPLSSPIVGDSIPVPTTPGPSTLPGRTPAPTSTTEVFALIPTNTPPVIFPTYTSAPPTTPTPRPDQSVPIQGPSLITFRSTKVSFQTAYAKAAARMVTVNGAARLVLAQATTFTLDQTIWTFFFTVPQGTKTWAVTFDSGANDKKEQITLTPSVTLLADEAGQWQVSKVLDSDDLSTRLQRSGVPPQLPFDTVYVQLQPSAQGKVPAYLLVNSALQKQLVVNALDATIMRNDFL
jgi:hypothetical protein